VSLDWGLIVVAGITGAIGALVGFVVASVMVGRAGLDHMEAEYEALHQHVHSTLGLKPPKGNA
jgi:hypothetical protein